MLDLEPSARVGREIIAEHGLSDRVEHEVGDLFTSDLGGPHDVVLTFNIVHHLDGEQIADLARRIHASLRPGGTWAVLDYFKPEGGRGSGAHALLGLFFFLTSSAATYRESEIRGWMTGAGLCLDQASADQAPAGLPALGGAESRLSGYSPMALR